MQKTVQEIEKLALFGDKSERSWANKLREKVNIPSSQLDKFFNPQMEKVMNKLKETDDQIRAYLSGKIIGDANPLDSLSAKDLLKSAQSNFNRREFMIGASELGRFNKLMLDVVRAIASFHIDVNQIHHKFLFDGIKDTEHDRNLKKLREHMEGVNKKALDARQHLIKEAGIMDFFHNIGSKRGRALAAWTKRYPKETRQLESEGKKLVLAGQKLLEKTIAHLKEMATARATRQPDTYIAIASQITKSYSGFDSAFKTYYDNQILPWLKIRDAAEAKEKEKQEAEQSSGVPTVPVSDAGQMGSQEVATQESPESEPESEPESKAFPLVNKAPYAESNNTQRAPVLPPGILSPPATPNAPAPEDLAPDTERMPSTVRSAHVKFLQSLESMSDESPSILASYISKYASQIQKSDPDSAIKLFQMARQIKEQA